jgi:hypothetical protein
VIATVILRGSPLSRLAPQGDGSRQEFGVTR